MKERGAESIGLTLSQGQADACQKNGFNVIVKDCRYIKPEDFGTFDAITCIGGLEHFCSVEEWQAGKQEQVYRDFFKILYDLLPVGGRFYMQTMVFSKNMIEFEEMDVNAEEGSAAHIMALMVPKWLLNVQHLVLNLFPKVVEDSIILRPLRSGGRNLESLI